MYEIIKDFCIGVENSDLGVGPTRFKPQEVEEECLRHFKNANSYDIALFEKFVEADEHMMSLSQIKNQVDTEIITMNT